MNYGIVSACTCHMGKIRGNNEDNLYFNGKYLPADNGNIEYPWSWEGSSENMKVFAVFDGIGGELKGELASYISANVLAELVEQSKSHEVNPGDFLKKAIEEMNRCVCEQTRKECISRMGNTCVILCFIKDQVYICNLGDSPAFRMHGQFWETISVYHTNADMMTLQQKCRKKPALTQCIGIPKEELTLEPYIAKGTLAAGDKFLICSDGLTDMVSEHEIVSILSSGLSVTGKTEYLLEQALKNGGRDNITVVYCEIKQEIAE
ncbi:MAG: serine/threonine-protein phosphatase [Lachnospiraceae bacterium]|nr:serine/threonine-protein phosphatase [Lachnospiraceae bacterium]MDD3616645.1 serine/threonine-protein phosphatase [Lachnospiraceae bacterium]